MIIAFTNPVGLDKRIKRIQTGLERELLPLWGVESSQCAFYPRAYKDGDEYKLYVGNEEYRKFIPNDDYDFISFFLADENETFQNGRYQVSVTLFCMARLDKLYHDILDRADMNLRKDIHDLIEKYSEKVSSINTGKVEGLKDKQPYHIFKITYAEYYST